MSTFPVMGSGVHKYSSGMQLAEHQEGSPFASLSQEESLSMEISGSVSYGALRVSGKLTMAPEGAL